jgi:hypothetical protein
LTQPSCEFGVLAVAHRRSISKLLNDGKATAPHPQPLSRERERGERALQ